MPFDVLLRGVHFGSSLFRRINCGNGSLEYAGGTLLPSATRILAVSGNVSIIATKQVADTMQSNQKIHLQPTL